MQMLGKFIVLLIIGSLAGSIAGRIMTFSKQGYGRWINLAVGMIGALVGQAIFWMFHIDLGLGDLNISFEDLISAICGSILCIVIWWILRVTVLKPKPVKQMN